MGRTRQAHTRSWARLDLSLVALNWKGMSLDQNYVTQSAPQCVGLSKLTHTHKLSKRTEPKGLEKSENSSKKTYTHGWIKALDTLRNQAIKWLKDMNGIKVKPPPKLDWLIHSWIIKDNHQIQEETIGFARFNLRLNKLNLWEFLWNLKTLIFIPYDLVYKS